MVKLCILVGTTVGSGAFGYAGDALGLSFLWSFMLSGFGGVLAYTRVGKWRSIIDKRPAPNASAGFSIRERR